LKGLFAVVFATLMTTCSVPPSLLEQIVSQGTLRFVTRNSPSTFFYGPDGARGIEYELARGFADYLGVGFEIETADHFWQIFPAITDGSAHIGAAGITITGPRRDIVEFGPPYQTSRRQVIYRRGTKRPRDISDLLGKRIEVIADSSYVRTLHVARRDYPSLTWIEDATAGAEELVAEVARGEIDYTIIDSTIFALLRQYHPEARVAFSVGRPDSIAWALPRGADRLREAVAAYFAKITATGELQAVLDRYYFTARDFDYVGSRAFVRHVESRLPRYIEHFREAEKVSGLDWRLIAAVAYQESHWNPDAVSPTGVRGMMMLTEHTAEAVEVADRRDARASIIGGATYLARMRDLIPERIAEPDRLWMAMAAYNIGYGHLEDARIITEMDGGNPDSWAEVREHLPLLNEELWYSRVRRGYARGDVPVLYVDNVRRYYELLQWVVSPQAPEPEPEPLVEAGEATASTWSFFNVLPGKSP
jgi:membrane-bound lytic murein transglycosylase F